MKNKILSLFTSAVMASCMMMNQITFVNAAGSSVYRDVLYHGLTVNGGEPVRGVDISSVISLENSGVVYRDENGNPQDIFLTLKNAGVNFIRVRVWNDPFDEQGRTYGGGANDINTAVKIAERCAKYGLKLFVDFHYSDFWADPGEQQVPKAWRNYSLSQKAGALREFTSDSLRKIKATGVTIGMVQVGNETVSGLSGETDWTAITQLMKAGSEAVRSFDRNILVAVHFTNPEKKGNYKWLADTLYKSGVDYDVFASSYYPYWHGTLSNLTEQLGYVAQTYGKYVMAAETSWLYTLDDTDFEENTISAQSQLGYGASYGAGVQAQIDSVTDVFQAVADVGEKGIGVCYWEPAWITVGSSWQSNSVLWDRFGSGVCAAGSGNFSDWTGKPKGSAVDNQALFDKTGKPLDSLYVFSHIHGSSSENIIPNPGFEADGATKNPSGWKITSTTSGEYSKFEVNSEMNKSGKYAAHWYSPDDFKESRLTCEFKVPETGKYTFNSYISGENASYVADVYVNGDWKNKDTGEVTGYGSWNSAGFSFEAGAGDTVKIEFIINGWNGSYGSVDDCSLYLNEKQPADDNPVPDKKRQKGDIQDDGKVDAADAVLLRNYLLGSDSVSEDSLKYADMDSDSRTDIRDMLLLKAFILGDYSL